MSLYSCMLMSLMPVGKITTHSTTYVHTSKQPAGRRGRLVSKHASPGGDALAPGTFEKPAAVCAPPGEGVPPGVTHPPEPDPRLRQAGSHPDLTPV